MNFACKYEKKKKKIDLPNEFGWIFNVFNV